MGEHPFTEPAQDCWFELAGVVDEDRLDFVQDGWVVGWDVVEDVADRQRLGRVDRARLDRVSECRPLVDELPECDHAARVGR